MVISSTFTLKTLLMKMVLPGVNDDKLIQPSVSKRNKWFPIPKEVFLLIAKQYSKKSEHSGLPVCACVVQFTIAD